MTDKINAPRPESYINIVSDVYNKHAKNLGQNAESIFTTLQEACKTIETGNCSLGNLYSIFCKAIKAVVSKISIAIAKFAYDLATKLIKFFKESDVKVTNKRESLIDSVTSMADSTKDFISIDANNKLGYYMMSNNVQEAWCADTVRTFYTNIPGISKDLENEIKDIHSVSNFRDWGKAKGLYKETSTMKSADRADYIKNNVKPGDIMIEKRNKSHTGIVVEVFEKGYIDPETKLVYPPGSFRTVEGNTSNGLAYKIYPPDSPTLSGFIDMSSYLDEEETSQDNK